jgi:spectinomycin phosphotransferase
LRTRPVGLDEQVVVSALASGWGLVAEGLRYFPHGSGSYHWLADTTAGTRYFLTVDDLHAKPWLGADPESALDGLRAAFGTALMLRERALLRFVVPPVPAHGGEPVHRLTPDYSLAVFPLVEGDARDWGDEVSSADSDRLVRLLAELHLATPIVAAQALRRGLELTDRAELETALDELDRPWTGGPFSELARRELAVNADAIRDWLTAFDRLVGQVAARNADQVVTHGEPHPGNLIRADGQYRLVDWDTVALALPERDLWMLDDGSAGRLAPYTEATGRPIDHSAIALYRLAWTLADLTAYSSLLRSEHRADQDTTKAWASLKKSLPSRSPLHRGPHRPATEPSPATPPEAGPPTSHAPAT